MNRQRKVVITITYNEMGIIIDTKAEEVAQPNLQSTCNELATDCISRQAAIDVLECVGYDFSESGLSNLELEEVCEAVGEVRDDMVKRIRHLPSAQPDIPPYVAEIEAEYKKAVSMPYVNKPLAYALFQVWKKHDREEVSRNG